MDVSGTGDIVVKMIDKVFCPSVAYSLVGTAAAAKSLQSCLTLCDPIDGSPPGSPIPGISRQEYWSGLPFLSPMYENEK